MLLLLQLETLADVPPKVTVLLPCVEPKLIPDIVTEVPPLPEAGETVLMQGTVAVSAKHMPLLAIPLTLTTK